MPQPRATEREQDAVPTSQARVIDTERKRPSYPVRTQRGLIEAVIEAFAQLEAQRTAAASSPVNGDEVDPPTSGVTAKK
jgi:hypothetical protein